MQPSITDFSGVAEGSSVPAAPLIVPDAAWDELDSDGNPTGVCVWEGKNPITGKWYINYDQTR